MAKDHLRIIKAFDTMSQTFTESLKNNERRKAYKALNQMHGIVETLSNMPSVTSTAASQALADRKTVYAEHKAAYEGYVTTRNAIQYAVLQEVERRNRALTPDQRRSQVQQCAEMIKSGISSIEQYDMAFAMLSDNRRKVPEAAYALAELQAKYSY